MCDGVWTAQTRKRGATDLLKESSLITSTNIIIIVSSSRCNSVFEAANTICHQPLRLSCNTLLPKGLKTVQAGKHIPKEIWKQINNITSKNTRQKRKKKLNNKQKSFTTSANSWRPTTTTTARMSDRQGKSVWGQINSWTAIFFWCCSYGNSNSSSSLCWKWILHPSQSATEAGGDGHPDCCCCPGNLRTHTNTQYAKVSQLQPANSPETRKRGCLRRHNA